VTHPPWFFDVRSTNYRRLWPSRDLFFWLAEFGRFQWIQCHHYLGKPTRFNRNHRIRRYVYLFFSFCHKIMYLNVPKVSRSPWLVQSVLAPPVTSPLNRITLSTAALQTSTQPSKTVQFTIAPGSTYLQPYQTANTPLSSPTLSIPIHSSSTIFSFINPLPTLRSVQRSSPSHSQLL